MIMSGKRDALLNQVQLIDIHGTYFYDLIYIHLDEGQPRRARIGREDIYPDPRPGDRVRVAYVMNVATGVERAA